DGMFAADADHAFLVFERRAQLAFVPRANRLAQRHDAARRGVLRFVFFDGPDGGSLDVIRRGEVWLAGTEVGDVHALGLQLVGFRDDGCRWRDLDTVDAVGELHLSAPRSEEHTSELQSHLNLVCRLLLEKKNTLVYCLQLVCYAHS